MVGIRADDGLGGWGHIGKTSEERFFMFGVNDKDEYIIEHMTFMRPQSGD